MWSGTLSWCWAAAVVNHSSLSVTPSWWKELIPWTAMVNKLGTSHLQFDSQVMLGPAKHSPFVISCSSTVIGEVQEHQIQLLGFWNTSSYPHVSETEQIFATVWFSSQISQLIKANRVKSQLVKGLWRAPITDIWKRVAESWSKWSTNEKPWDSYYIAALHLGTSRISLYLG